MYRYNAWLFVLLSVASWLKGQETEKYLFTGPMGIRRFAIKTSPPHYPREYALAKREGSVTVELLISPEGEIRNLSVVAATDELFSRSVTTAVRNWVFRPRSLLSGEPFPYPLKGRLIFYYRFINGQPSVIDAAEEMLRRSLIKNDAGHRRGKKPEQ